MAYKILVVSPLHNSGTSVVSTLLSQGLTYDGKKSMLLYTESESLLPGYLGITDVDDPTRSITQVIKLINAEALDDDHVIDYAHAYAKNAYLMSVADKDLTNLDRTNIVRHVFNHAPTDIVIVDYSDDISQAEDTSLFQTADLVFVVTNVTPKHINRLKIWLADPLINTVKDVLVIVNNYNEVYGSTRNIAKMIGFAHSKVCQVHFNPWIGKCCMTGELPSVAKTAFELDARTVSLRQDMIELSQAVSSLMFESSKKVL